MFGLSAAWLSPRAGGAGGDCGLLVDVDTNAVGGAEECWSVLRRGDDEAVRDGPAAFSGIVTVLAFARFEVSTD